MRLDHLLSRRHERIRQGGGALALEKTLKSPHVRNMRWLPEKPFGFPFTSQLLSLLAEHVLYQKNSTHKSTKARVMTKKERRM